MGDDFYLTAAQQRFSRIEAERSRALADLNDARAAGDSESAGYVVQTIANLDAEARNLATISRQYQASQTPAPPPPEITAEERAAKPWDKMNYDDALALARNSKYGKDLTHDDPNVAAGYREVARRRQRGE